MPAEFMTEIEAPVSLVTVTVANSPYDISPKDDIVRIDSSLGDVVLNLQQASKATSRRLVLKKLTDDNKVTLNAYSGETLAGFATVEVILAGANSVYPVDGIGWEREVDPSSAISATVLRRSVKTITGLDSPYTFDPRDDILRVDTSTNGDVDILLPEAATSLVRTATLKKISGSGKMDVYPYSGEQIEFNPIDDYERVTVQGTALRVYAVNGKGWEYEG